MFPSTMFRVQRQTAVSVNDRIRERTKGALDHYLHSPRIELDERMGELSREWGIERTLETNAAHLFAGRPRPRNKVRESVAGAPCGRCRVPASTCSSRMVSPGPVVP